MSLNHARSPRELAIAVIDVCRDEDWSLAALVSHLGIEARRITQQAMLDAEDHPKEYGEDEVRWLVENHHEAQSIHA